MTELWIGIVIASAAAFALKFVGLAVPGTILDHPMTTRLVALVPVGLLAALVATQSFADGTELVIDARLAGLATAAVLLALRVPFLAMLVAAAVVTALVRQIS